MLCKKQFWSSFRFSIGLSKWVTVDVVGSQDSPCGRRDAPVWSRRAGRTLWGWSRIWEIGVKSSFLRHLYMYACLCAHVYLCVCVLHGYICVHISSSCGKGQKAKLILVSNPVSAKRHQSSLEKCLTPRLEQGRYQINLETLVILKK